MKKFVLILGLVFISFFMLNTGVQAEVYYGIDIDAVYESSDWSSKEKIKEIIDDYTLLLQYQKELDSCPTELPEVLGCYDKIAEKIVTNLYMHPKNNITEYKQLKKALSDAYGLKNCRNKYAWPSGSICDIDRASDLSASLRNYIQDLIDFSKEQMFSYSSILEEYN
ncbi:MAG: hypothetical protein IJ770_05320 [Alphaproteobacteria bacterium]|nr:hypothetical protein [Alphaproteobacteria bacterium]